VRSTISGPKRIRLVPWQLRLVRKVAECYWAMQYLQPTVASTIDDAPGVRSPKWTPESSHYKVDVSHAVRDAIANRQDVQELNAAWERLQNDSSTIRETEATLIRLVAPIFEERELEPWKYFRVVRHGRGKR
jgi:hypothetical protein